MKQSIESSFVSPDNSQSESYHNSPQISPGIDQLITIDYTQPEGSDKKYCATVVPRYGPAPEKDSDLDHFVFQQKDGSIVTAELSETDFVPIQQSMDSRSGFAATPEEAARIALSNWIKSQHLHAHDGIDVPLQ